eukprot:jgi/Mesvir1/1500/Mv14483-RA.1
MDADKMKKYGKYGGIAFVVISIIVVVIVVPVVMMKKKRERGEKCDPVKDFWGCAYENFFGHPSSFGPHADSVETVNMVVTSTEVSTDVYPNPDSGCDPNASNYVECLKAYSDYVWEHPSGNAGGNPTGSSTAGSSASPIVAPGIPPPLPDSLGGPNGPAAGPTASLNPVKAPVVPAGTQAAVVAAGKEPAPATAPAAVPVTVAAPVKPVTPATVWKECDGTPYKARPLPSQFGMTAAGDLSPEEFKKMREQLKCAIDAGKCKGAKGEAEGMKVGAVHYDGKALVWLAKDGKIQVVAPQTLREPVSKWKRSYVDFATLKCIKNVDKYLGELKKEGVLASYELSPEMTVTTGSITTKFRYAFAASAKKGVSPKDLPLACYCFKTDAGK